ncbi:unnamed protein product, partial [marine sediment metagenome]
EGRDINSQCNLNYIAVESVVPVCETQYLSKLD